MTLNVALTWSVLDMSKHDVADSVKRMLSVRKGGSLLPSQVKPVACKIDICCYLPWCSALLG